MLSVTAQVVNSLRVLLEIGANVDFGVEGYGVSAMVSNFSIKDASLEMVLGRLQITGVPRPNFELFRLLYRCQQGE